MIRLSQRIRDDKITMRIAQRGDVPLSEIPSSFTWYDVTLRIPHDDNPARSAGKLTQPFGIHPSQDESHLDIESVMAALVMFSRSVYLNLSRDGEEASFLAWADEWDFDPGDGKRRRTWEENRDLMYRLKSFLGTGKFKAYMTDTSDDI